MSACGHGASPEGTGGAGGCTAGECPTDSGVDGDVSEPSLDAPSTDDRGKTQAADAPDADEEVTSSGDGESEAPLDQEADAHAADDSSNVADALDANDAIDDDSPTADADAAEAADTSSCDDGLKNGSETAVDCGGPSCPPCPLYRACVVNGDCRSASCLGSLCSLASGPPYWLPGVPMTSARANHAATLIPTGVSKGTIIVI